MQKRTSMLLALSALALAESASATPTPVAAHTPTGRMKAQVRRRAAVVAANPKQTSEQKAWNDAVEARKRAKKGR